VVLSETVVAIDSIAEAIRTFDASFTDNESLFLVVGKDDLNAAWKLHTSQFIDNIKTYKIEPGFMYAYDDTWPVLNKQTSIIMVGGPCANPHWHLLSEELCETWSLTDGTALIKYVELPTTRALLIGGTSKRDTQVAIDILINLTEPALFLNTTAILVTQ